MNVNPSRNILKNSDIQNFDKNETRFFDLYFDFVENHLQNLPITKSKYKLKNFVLILSIF